MSENPFAAPAPATGGIDLKTLLGALLIVEPLSVETGIQTSYGPTDAVRANVHVVDGPTAGEVHDDTLIFPKVLQSQLKSRIGQKVLGRLGQGQAKPGQSAPWVINEATGQDIAAGTDYLTKRQSGQFAQPAPQQQAQAEQSQQQVAAGGEPPF